MFCFMFSRLAHRGMTITLAMALATFGLTIASGSASATDTWVTTGSVRADSLTESQGLASVYLPVGRPNRYTGVGTIPSRVLAAGWNHVGDPDASRDGYYIEPYENSSASSKMFRVQSPSGAWSRYTHKLDSGEAYNNSFDAISPDGQWMVSGEYGTMSRFLMFPTPGQNASTSPSANLPLAATITLDHPVVNIQGCDFTTATQLLCSSDDGAGTQFGITRPLLQIDLPAALSGSNINAHVTPLRQVPLVSSCTGTFETEGIDYDTRTGILRVIVLSPSICLLTDSKTWTLVMNG